MPRKLSLRGFLRQDIISKRNSDLTPRRDSRTSSLKRDPGANFPLASRSQSDSPFEKAKHESFGEVDSIFGETIVTKDEILQQKLEQFLAKDRKDGDSEVKHPHHPVLEALKEELNILINQEFNAGLEERELIRRQKSGLIREIGRLEAKDRYERIRGHKGMSISLFREIRARGEYFSTRRTDLLTVSVAIPDELAKLPEPIGLAEKKRLQLAKERASKAVLGLEVWPWWPSWPGYVTQAYLQHFREVARSESAKSKTTSSMVKSGFELESNTRNCQSQDVGSRGSTITSQNLKME
jgi:hypothetical protein